MYFSSMSLGILDERGPLHETFRIIEPHLKEAGFRYTPSGLGFDYADGRYTCVTCDKWELRPMRGMGWRSSVKLFMDGTVIKTTAPWNKLTTVIFDLHHPKALPELVAFLKKYY